MDALLFILIIVTDNVGSARWIREEDSKTWWIPESLRDLLGSFEGSCCLNHLFIFNEGKFRKNLNFFNYAVVRHQLSHRNFVKMLRDAS